MLYYTIFLLFHASHLIDFFAFCLSAMFYPFCGDRYQAVAYIEASAFIYQDGKVILFFSCIFFG